jgi:hypothetical protein
MNLFNVQINTMSEQELDKIFPLGFRTFEIYSSPCRVDGQLRA